jgi:pSer/pThr/pTyr-binding forkhead associated (FHA) protein
MEKSILPRIEKKRTQKEPLAELLGRIDEAIESISEKAENNPEESEPASTASDDSIKLALKDNSIEHDPDPFEAQKEEEIVFDDFISELADPDNETSETGQIDEQYMARIEPVERESNETLIPFPNLIITAGIQAGKKIPLLPMTMTIGREHDNNIELKDEEVARYHSRILFHDGQFVLEDLKNSTGTWVNKKKISRVTLKNSDKIRLGSTELIIDFS